MEEKMRARREEHKNRLKERDGSYRDLERGSRDEMLNRHKHRHGDRGHHNKEEFEAERHKKFLDMNRRRADRLKSQVIAAKFSPEVEASMLAEVEEYHDKEFEQAEHNHNAIHIVQAIHSN